MGKKGRMMDYKSEQSISKAIFMNFSFLRAQIFPVGLRINDFEQVKIKITNISKLPGEGLRIRGNWTTELVDKENKFLALFQGGSDQT